MLPSILVAIVLILCAIHFYIRGGRRGKYIAKIPGPPGWPIIGNVFDFLVPLEQFWEALRQMDRDYYPFYKFWLMDTPVVVILEPDDAQILLTSTQHIDKSNVYNYLHPWFRTGVLTSTGEKWVKRKKILTPSFHFNVLRKYLDIMVENGEKTIQSLLDHGESVQSVLPVVMKHTLNVICESAMGTSLQGKESYREEYTEASKVLGNVFKYRSVRPWLDSDWIFNLTQFGKKQSAALKGLHLFSSKIISERIKYHEETDGRFLSELEEKNEIEDVEFSGHRKKRLGMLDLLIAAYREGEEIDDEGMHEEVDTFIFAGQDTTALALCFFLLLMAEHKDIQDRIREEINNVVKDSGGKMGASEIQKLTYIDRCIRESLRLYPSAPTISRDLTKDLQLKNYLIPKGTRVDVQIFEIQRNPNYWPDPLKYNPDRFLPENVKDRHPFSYMPFSAGPRTCIGRRYAFLEIKALVSQIIHNFYLEPIDLAHNIPILPDFLLRPGTPMRVKFIPIKK